MLVVRRWGWWLYFIKAHTSPSSIITRETRSFWVFYILSVQKNETQEIIYKKRYFLCSNHYYYNYIIAFWTFLPPFSCNYVSAFG